MAQYSFPILENDELLPCMEEMEIPLTAAQLAKPTYEVVGPLFESVLISLTGITRCVCCSSCTTQHTAQPLSTKLTAQLTTLSWLQGGAEPAAVCCHRCIRVPRAA